MGIITEELLLVTSKWNGYRNTISDNVKSVPRKETFEGIKKCCNQTDNRGEFVPE